MTHLAEQLFSQAMQLPQVEREELAEQLYLSLHSNIEPQNEVESAWKEEVANRIQSVDEESVSLISAEQVHSDIRKILNGRQS